MPDNGQTTKRHPRQGIIDLIACIRCYRPLVNEKDLIERAKKQEVFTPINEKVDFNRDQVLALAIGAVADMSNFIKAYEEMKDKYEALTSDAMIAYVAGKEMGIEAESLAELTDALAGKFKQACDVMRRIGELSHDSDVQAITEQFLSRFVIEQAKVVRPDFDVPDQGATAPEPPPPEIK